MNIKKISDEDINREPIKNQGSEVLEALGNSSLKAVRNTPPPRNAVAIARVRSESG